MERLISARLIGLQGCLARPAWGGIGLLAVISGGLAANALRLDSEGLLTLLLVLLLTNLGWGTFWNLVVVEDWFHFLARGWPPEQPATVPALPYTQPTALGGRIARWLGRWLGWWRESLVPEKHLALVALVITVVLTVILTLTLPVRLMPLSAAVIALIGIALAQRLRGRSPLAATALLQVGLGWMAGHLAFSEMTVSSWGMAFCFSLAVLGILRAAEDQGAGLWLQDGSQIVIVVLLIVLEQPVAAGLAGLFLLGQIVLQPGLHISGQPARIRYSNHSWPWLMGAMLTAALALP